MQQSNFNPEDTEIAFSHLSDKAIFRRHRIFSVFNLKFIVQFGNKVIYYAFKSGLPISFLFPKIIFRLFVGGTKLKESIETAETLSKRGVHTILDYAVEAKSSAAAYEKTLKENINSIQKTTEYPYIDYVSSKISGLADNELLESFQKKEALSPQHETDLEKVKKRLNRLAETSAQHNTGILFDAEESWVQDSMDHLVENLIQTYNKEKAVVYNTFQLYRHDKLEYLKAQIEDAKEKGYILGAKLVRGAYLEKEHRIAKKKGYPSPIQKTKVDTDNDFNKAVEICLENIQYVSFCIATHNETSCMKAIEKATSLNIPLNHPHFFFSQLFGMGDHLTYNLAAAGCNATKYIPYGPVKEAIPYLIRRIEENSAVPGQMGRELRLLKMEMERRKLV